VHGTNTIIKFSASVFRYIIFTIANVTVLRLGVSKN